MTESKGLHSVSQMDRPIRRAQIAAMISIELKLESVEWFRSTIDVVPYGHNAAVVLVGASLPLLKEQLAMRTKGRQIFIAGD